MMIVALFVFGLIIGSFLGALTFRLPRDLGISRGRSFCPNCKKQISWYDNIPLLSYLILQGKCRSCKQKISGRYPLIEFSTAVVFAIIGFNPAALLVAAILIAIFVIDLEHQIIPDELVFIGMGIVILNFIFLDSPLLFEFLLSGGITALVLLGIHLVTKGNGMGLGDVKLSLLIGSMVLLSQSLVWLLLSFVIGGGVGVVLIVLGKAKMKQRVAFGPFLILGFVAYLLLNL